jgi:hypothetical protein
MTFAWTEEHVTRLREGAAAGKSAGEIAIELGVTRNTIIGKLRRMKIPLVSVLAQQRRIRTLCADDRAAIRAATSATPRRPKMFRPKIVKPVPARVLAPAPAPKLPEVNNCLPAFPFSISKPTNAAIRSMMRCHSLSFYSAACQRRTTNVPTASRIGSFATGRYPGNF